MAQQQRNVNQLMPLSSGCSRSRGGLFSPAPKMEYSSGTVAVVTELSLSSRLSHKQNKALLLVLRSGGSLPPSSPSSAGSGSGKLEKRAEYMKRRQLHGREIGLELGAAIKPVRTNTGSPFQQPLRRSFSSILASGDLQPVRFRGCGGTAPSASRDAAKAQLALHMEFGKHPSQPAAAAPEPTRKPPPSIDELKKERLTELHESLHSRLCFLQEMHALGVHEHDGYINSQLAALRKEMEEDIGGGVK